MADDRRRLAFLSKFERVCCNYCFQCLSSNPRLYALQCYHIFCQKCLPKVCKLNNRNQRLFQCGICDKVARCAKFSEDLPREFLKLFVPIKFNGFFRTIDFRMKYRKRRVILMRGRLFKIRNAVKRLYQQGYVVQRQKSDYLKRKREAIRRHLLNEFSNGYIDWLISYPLRRLQGMRFKDGSSRKPRFISEHIDENSSTPLIRQVLLRNASSSPSSCSRNRSSSH